MPIYLDPISGAYTDGLKHVQASVIRKHAREKMGKAQLRGRLTIQMIESYWLDTFERAENVERS